MRICQTFAFIVDALGTNMENVFNTSLNQKVNWPMGHWPKQLHKQRSRGRANKEKDGIQKQARCIQMFQHK